MWLFFFKCCGDANGAAAYGASEFEVVGFHGTHFLPKKIGYSGKSGNNLPCQGAVGQQSVHPVPQAFMSTGYQSLVRKGVKRKAGAALTRAWVMVRDRSPALGIAGVPSQGPRLLRAESTRQWWHQPRGLQLS